ncbi:hypothetical protein ZHS_44 [Edwardsiella phage vB_EpM_ZHS]|jgi:hypothetical protein|nr:hypothetical protein ZHS_44 [Edwardsiella phage vB_EpM_ZHS]
MKSAPKFFIRDADRGFWIGEVWRTWWHRMKGPGVVVDRLRSSHTGAEHFFICCQATVAILMRWEAQELCAYEAWEWGTELAWRHTGSYEIDGEVGYAFDVLRMRGLEYIIQSDGTL